VAETLYSDQIELNHYLKLEKLREILKIILKNAGTR
jgi:hypothetical protein